MRSFGSMHPTDLIPVPPDTVGVAVVSSASAVVSQDIPSGAEMVVFGSPANFWCRIGSTGVAIPSASTAGSSGGNPSEFLRDGTTYQIPGGSTGLSISATAGMTISLSYWGK